MVLHAELQLQPKTKPILNIGRIAVYDKNYLNSSWEHISKNLMVHYDTFRNKKDFINHINKTNPAIIIINLDSEKSLADFLTFFNAYSTAHSHVFLMTRKINKLEHHPNLYNDFNFVNLNEDDIVHEIEPALRKSYIKTSIENYNGLYIGGETIVGKSQPMLELFNDILKNANSDRNCLIQGATGTGKSLIAKALHYFHPYRNLLTFSAKDIGTIPVSLFETEMFGHEKGSFTGADKKRSGCFSTTDGTLFLDEIGNCPMEQQAKLLTAIHDKIFSKLGSTVLEEVKARIIFGTNETLNDKVKAGHFRSDLYHRISTLEIRLPSLGERKDDITVLVDFFVKQWNTANRKNRAISQSVKDMLREYTWPGNIRELISAVEKLLQNTDHKTIELHHLGMKVIKESGWYNPTFVVGFDPCSPFPEESQKTEEKKKPIHVLFGEEIEKREMSDEEVARDFGWSKATICYYKKGIVEEKNGKIRTIPKRNIIKIMNWISTPPKSEYLEAIPNLRTAVNKNHDDDTTPETARFTPQC